MIKYLVEVAPWATDIEDLAGYKPERILLEAKRELDVIRCVADEWPCQESIYTPLANKKNSEQAMYCLENDDPDLCDIAIGWPLPTESVLIRVVNAIASHLTIGRLHFVSGEYETLPFTVSETTTKELLTTALRENTSITSIRINRTLNHNLLDYLEVMHHSR